MKLLAYLLITVALAVGAASATNAYLWQLPEDPALDEETFRDGERADGSPRYLELAADAGNVDGSPVANASTLDAPVQLTPELVEELRAAGVEKVRVKKFSLSKWRGSTWFLFAALGLTLGALVVRRENARELKALREAAGDDTLAPSAAIGIIRDTIAGLNDTINATPKPEAQCAAIVDRLGELQQTAIPAIVDGRSRLVAELGLGKYAEFMDAFSACERQINRAWSAAADGVAEEASWCVLRAEELLAGVQAKLPEPPPPPSPAPRSAPTTPSAPPPPSPAAPIAAAGVGSTAASSPAAIQTITPPTEAPSPPPAPPAKDDPLAELGIQFRKDNRPTPGVDPYSVQELADETGVPEIDDPDPDDEDPSAGGPKIEL